MLHFVRSRNLPYSIDQIKGIISSCEVCNRIKPQFARPTPGNLIRSLRPFDRLSMDFKGPLQSSSPNKYILIIVDEYSRFPFAFPCREMTTAVVINCLSSLFSIFGLPLYLHSDRGTAFMSSELKSFLSRLGVSTSKSTPYHPAGNGQCERYVGIVWKTILLALTTKKLDSRDWEVVLPDALHSIRSLLCTSTNTTPHERLFSYPRNTASGQSVPSWLLAPGQVLLRRQRRTKDEPLVQEVELISANPQYAHIRFPNGREDTVNLRDLAPSTNSSINSETPICESPGIQNTKGDRALLILPEITQA